MPPLGFSTCVISNDNGKEGRYIFSTIESAKVSENGNFEVGSGNLKMLFSPAYWPTRFHYQLFSFNLQPSHCLSPQLVLLSVHASFHSIWTSKPAWISSPLSALHTLGSACAALLPLAAPSKNLCSSPRCHRFSSALIVQTAVSFPTASFAHLQTVAFLCHSAIALSVIRICTLSLQQTFFNVSISSPSATAPHAFLLPFDLHTINITFDFDLLLFDLW